MTPKKGLFFLLGNKGIIGKMICKSEEIFCILRQNEFTKCKDHRIVIKQEETYS